jgi:riboflavin kinase/FMN adenylyltransferase
MFAKQTYEGMLSIGKNPTVSNQNILSIEVNIFEFNADIYNKEITVFIYKKLRDEEKYSSLDELKAQLAVDKQNALKFLI